MEVYQRGHQEHKRLQMATWNGTICGIFGAILDPLGQFGALLGQFCQTKERHKKNCFFLLSVKKLNPPPSPFFDPLSFF